MEYGCGLHALSFPLLADAIGTLLQARRGTRKDCVNSTRRSQNDARDSSASAPDVRFRGTLLQLLSRLQGELYGGSVIRKGCRAGNRFTSEYAVDLLELH